MIQDKITTTPNTPWLMPFSRGGNGRLNLFFFPHAGGGASAFYQWSHVLPQEITSYAIQLPGRETRLREPLHHELSTVIDLLAGELRPYLENAPFIFWGHSMGALLAFELVRRLQQDGQPWPQRLLVSGYNAPQIPYADPKIHHLPEGDFITALEGLNGTPEAVLQDAELRELVLPIVRADFQLVETYAHEEAEPLPCPITVLDGVADDKTNEADLKEWQQQSTQALELFAFPGDHFFLYDLQPKLISTVLYLLNRQLQDIRITLMNGRTGSPSP
ncbi:MAG: putative thioesterase [Anaerolineaceae bacterium]|nr:putative thioesterase [Anaerolineaceae bacterium]